MCSSTSSAACGSRSRPPIWRSPPPWRRRPGIVPLPADLVLIGEVGLSGELRAVAQLPARLREASRLGFRRAIVPRSTRLELGGAPGLAGDRGTQRSRGAGLWRCRHADSTDVRIEASTATLDSAVIPCVHEDASPVRRPALRCRGTPSTVTVTAACSTPDLGLRKPRQRMWGGSRSAVEAADRGARRSSTGSALTWPRLKTSIVLGLATVRST